MQNVCTKELFFCFLLCNKQQITRHVHARVHVCVPVHTSCQRNVRNVITTCIHTCTYRHYRYTYTDLFVEGAVATMTSKASSAQNNYTTCTFVPSFADCQSFSDVWRYSDRGGREME